MAAKRSTAISLVSQEGQIIGDAWQHPTTINLPHPARATRETRLIVQQTTTDLLEEEGLAAKAKAALWHEQQIYQDATPALMQTLALLDHVRQQPHSNWLQAQVDGATDDLALLARRHSYGTIEGCNVEIANVARRSITPPPPEPPPPPPKPRSLKEILFG